MWRDYTKRLCLGHATVFPPVLAVDLLEVVRAGPDVVNGALRLPRLGEVVLLAKLQSGRQKHISQSNNGD